MQEDTGGGRAATVDSRSSHDQTAADTGEAVSDFPRMIQENSGLYDSGEAV